MGLGLLGALGGLGRAGGDIADQTMRERADADKMARMEQMRMAAEERAVSRADDRDDRKLAMENDRIVQRRGLLGEVLGQMPEGSSDFDRSRRLLDAGLIDEAKAYGDLGKAGDTSEYRQKTLELQHEKRMAAIENARLKLEASGGKKDVTFGEYEGMTPERREAYDKFKGRKDGSDGATSTQKDARWLVDNGMAKDLPEAFSMLKADQGESTVRALTQQILADPRNMKMSPEQARKRAMDIIATEKGQPGASTAPATAARPVDLNQFFKK